MAPPDLNSLQSSSLSSSPRQQRSMQTAISSTVRRESPSPRPSLTSLAAAASINAADHSRRLSGGSRGSPQLERRSSTRRRSQVAININFNDPTIPSPGELSSSDRRASQSYMNISPSTIGGRTTVATGDPHHQRQPSLGDIHNELEQEQEAQVNRMLQMIRDQQLQLEALRTRRDSSSQRSSRQNSTSAGTNANGAVIDDSTPGSDRSTSFPSIHPAVSSFPPLPHRISRNPSSANRSPALRPLPGQENSPSLNSEWPPSPTETSRRDYIRDESAFYQAETQALTRENQMLRQRIRELERQIADSNSVPANTPSIPSNLSTSPTLRAEEAASIGRTATEVEKI